MICRRRSRCFQQQQRTSRAPALKSIPEDQSVLFVSQSGKGEHSNNNEDASAAASLDFFPGLLERDFEDVDVSLVNRSRVVRRVDPLRRCHQLDVHAQSHAECMAARQAVHHSVDSVEALKCKLNSDQVGENVLRGKSVYQIHRDTLEKPESNLYSNMMSDKYDEMGSGKAEGMDGFLYWVLLFRYAPLYTEDEWEQEE